MLRGKPPVFWGLGSERRERIGRVGVSLGRRRRHVLAGGGGAGHRRAVGGRLRHRHLRGAPAEVFSLLLIPR